MTSRAVTGAEAARTQSLFRDVNERVVELTGPDTEQVTVLCECANEDCSSVLFVAPDEYEAVRRHPTHFLVHRGHVVPGVERVLASIDGYVVVEKFGEAGSLAVALDSRRKPTAASG